MVKEKRKNKQLNFFSFPESRKSSNNRAISKHTAIFANQLLFSVIFSFDWNFVRKFGATIRSGL
jgi:hypothetical protein